MTFISLSQRCKPCAVLFLLLVPPALASGSQPQKAQKEVLPYQPGQELIRITSSTAGIELLPDHRSPGGLGPWASSAIIKMKVQSVLPVWSVVVEPTTLQGPEGKLPPDRIWVKTDETNGTFAPLTKPVTVLSGDFRNPVKETEMTVEVRPAWKDPPGKYEGTLILQPVGPENGRLVPKPASEPALAQSGGREEPQPVTPAPGRGTPVMGLPQPVTVSLTIQEIIQVAISGGELRFEGIGGEGTYRADQEVRFRVLTNARDWRVVCNASNLKGERGEIPAERIKWERMDERGKVLDKGDLGLDSTVLRSSSSRIDPEKDVILRFAIDVTMADVAGSYKGSISLQGITGQ